MNLCAEPKAEGGDVAMKMVNQGRRMIFSYILTIEEVKYNKILVTILH